MIDGYTEKSPTELKTFDADFAAELPSGDVIRGIGPGSSTTVTAVDSTGFDVTQTIIALVTITTSKLRIKFQAGTDKMNYTIIARAQMNLAGTIFDKVYELRVRSNRRTF